jgi:TIR domain
VKWDVFISHASEDKELVARPLAQLLTGSGLHVWLDENELRLGDSLRIKLDQGLAASQFGVVVLSRAFFAKDWPQRELDGLRVGIF